LSGENGRALVIDDERPIRKFLREALKTDGLLADEAASAGEAMAKLTENSYDIVLLDLGLPDSDGKELIARVREWSDVPVIVISVRERESEKIAALDAGADDYITKPFGVGELLARIRATLRRPRLGESPPVVSIDRLTVDLSTSRVTVDGVPVVLTPTEYDILRLMAQNPGKVLTHVRLLTEVWGSGHSDDAHLLRVNISNLRRKIEPDPVRPAYIVTEPGVGYRLRDY
jgi:two-component system, OmpR family, KDP operon response regulator KdpE